MRTSTLVLAGLGLAMLVVGIWVEDREAVAAPLVIIGALVVVIGVIVETWADIEEMSVSQLGVTLKRRAPTAEQLTESGLPPQVADALEQWLEDVTRLLPEEIDKRVHEAVAQGFLQRSRNALMRAVAEQRMREQWMSEPAQPSPAPGPGAATDAEGHEPPEPGPGAA